MATLGALFSIFFHIIVPGWIIYEIFVEIHRKKQDIIGYSDKTKNSNIVGLITALVVYIGLVILFHKIFLT